MSSSFCSRCVLSWLRDTIMDCELCNTHLQNGWSIQNLMDVYGKKYEVFKLLHEEIDVFPPLKSRKVLKKIHFKNEFRLENCVVYDMKFDALPLPLQHYLKDIKSELMEMNMKENEEQTLAFLKQEQFLLRHLQLSSTKELQASIFDGLDPFTQYLLSYNKLQ